MTVSHYNTFVSTKVLCIHELDFVTFCCPCGPFPCFPVLHFHPYKLCPTFSSPEFSAFASFVVLHFPVPRFHRPRFQINRLRAGSIGICNFVLVTTWHLLSGLSRDVLAIDWLSADSLTIIFVEIYCYWTRTVGVIAKGSRGPVFFETQCISTAIGERGNTEYCSQYWLHYVS